MGDITDLKEKKVFYFSQFGWGLREGLKKKWNKLGLSWAKLKFKLMF